MATKVLTYVIAGVDRLSPVAKKAAGETEGAFSSVSKAAGLLTGATIAAFGGAEAIKAASNFQSAMEKIHTQAGASQSSISGLSTQVLKLGTTAQQSPLELANALYHLKSVGLDNVNAMKALKQSSDLAAVGGADLEETTNALAGAWRSGIKGAQSFGETASTVNAIIGAGNMRMEDFVQAIGTGILPSAKTFGVSLQSVGASLALMTDEGVPAVDAATRLRMSLSLLGAPSHAAQKALSEIGVNGLDLANAMRGPQGIIGAIQMLKDHLDSSGLSASQQAQVLSKAFGGGRSSSAILTLVNNLDVLKKKQEQINATTGSYGDAVTQQRKTASAQFAILKSNVDVLAIELGTFLLPPITRFAAYLTSTAIPSARKFGTELYPIFHIGFTDFMAGISAIAKAFASMPGPIRLATVAIALFGIALKIAAANPWTALALGLVLAVGIIVKNWKTIGPVFESVKNGIMTGYHDFVNAMIKAFDDVRNFVIGVWHAIENNFFGQVLIAAIKIWWAATKLQFQIAWLFISGIFDLIVLIGKKAWGLLVDFWHIEWIILKPQLWLLWTVLSTIFTTIWKAGQLAWNLIGTTFSWMWNNILHPAIMFLWNTISGVFGGIVNGAADAFGWVPVIGPKLKSAADAFNKFRDQVNSALNGINNKTVSVNVNMATGTAVGSGGGHRIVAAQGAFVNVGTTPTADDVLARVSRGELIVPTHMVRAGEVDHLRGRIPGFAGGGGFGLNASFPSTTSVNNMLNTRVEALANQFVNSLQSALTGGISQKVGNVGSGVMRWASLVLKALSMEGLGSYLASQVLYQMQTESGGNPNAINLWDSNAAAGDPSRGLLQTIMSTFLKYHWPGTSFNIYDPLANIAAAINYARHTYGPTLISGGMGMGSGHGYKYGGLVSFDSGGWLAPHSATMAINGTDRYEPVGQAGGNTYVINVHPTPMARPADIGREVVGAIKEFERGAGKGWRS